MCEHHAKQHRGGGRERQFVCDISAARARIDAKEAPSPDLREAKRLQLARPMMRRGTGFDANQARRQLLEKRQNVAPLDLAAKHHIALRIDGAMAGLPTLTFTPMRTTVVTMAVRELRRVSIDLMRSPRGSRHVPLL